MGFKKFVTLPELEHGFLQRNSIQIRLDLELLNNKEAYWECWKRDTFLPVTVEFFSPSFSLKKLKDKKPKLSL